MKLKVCKYKLSVSSLWIYIFVLIIFRGHKLDCVYRGVPLRYG